jgi:hypothetical protein
MTVPTRFRGTGTLLVKGAEQSPVKYEITVFEVDTVIRTEGWIEASPGVLTYAQSHCTRLVIESAKRAMA